MTKIISQKLQVRLFDILLDILKYKFYLKIWTYPKWDVKFTDYTYTVYRLELYSSRSEKNC